MEDTRPGAGTPSWPIRLLRWPLVVAARLVRVVPQAVDGYFADRCSQHAAGIAYRVLFSLVPLSIVLVAIFGLVLRDDSLRNDVISEIVDRLPLSDSGSADVTREIEKLASPATGLGLFSLLVFGWASTGMMASLRAGLEVAMRVPRGRPAARGKLVDLILIVGAAALLVLVVLLNLVTQFVSDTVKNLIDRLGLTGGLARPGVARRRAAPADDGRRADALPLRAGATASHPDAVAGASITAVLLLAISAASGVIYDRTRSLGNIYGSLTLVLIFLYSVYLYASALLLGAEVAAAWSRPAEGPGEPIGKQVRRVVLGLFVHQEPPASRPVRPRVPTDPR